MIKYIFTKSEMKTLFYLTEHSDFNCVFFDVITLKQLEFEEAQDGLIAKNVLYRINNKEIKVDKMFHALIDVIVNSEYICSMEHVMVAVGSQRQGGIAVVLEEDVRNSEIVKMIPYRNIEEVVEEYGTDLLMS